MVQSRWGLPEDIGKAVADARPRRSRLLHRPGHHGRGRHDDPAAVTKDLHALPRWAPRVAPERIRRLYKLDAHGIYDEDLILDVGYGLLARCESFITAVAASQGRVTCPLCGATVHHGHDKSEEMRCACGWSLTWGDYFATIQHKQLSGAEPVLALFGDFVDRFPRARTPQQRMILIDTLLHGFHIYAKTGNPTRPSPSTSSRCAFGRSSSSSTS